MFSQEESRKELCNVAEEEDGSSGSNSNNGRTASTSSSPRTRPTHRKRGSCSVSFGSVEIREFNRIVGDHPDCSLGPPMSIGWDFVEKEQVAVDDYDRDQRTRRHGLYALDSHLRKEILQVGFQVSEEEIRQAEKQVEKAAKLREKTLQQLKLSKKTHAILRSASRMFRGTSSNKTTTSPTISSPKSVITTPPTPTPSGALPSVGWPVLPSLPSKSKLVVVGPPGIKV